MNLEVLTRIGAIEQEISALKQTIGSDLEYGLAKVTNSSSVNTENGIAMSAMQNNAAIHGTLANRTKELEAKTIDRSLLYENSSHIETGATLSLAHSNYDILEVHWRFEPNQYDTRVNYVPKGSHIIVHTIGVNFQDSPNTFFGDRKSTRLNSSHRP